MEQKNNRINLWKRKKNINNARFGGARPNPNSNSYKGGELAPEEKEEQIRKIKENMDNKQAELKKEKEKLKILSDNLNKLIVNVGEQYNLYSLIKYLKETYGGDDDDDNISGNVISKKYNDNDTLFEKYGMNIMMELNHIV